MGIYAFKPAFRRLLAPLARALVRVHPDVLSYAAVVVAAAAGAGIALAPGRDWLYLAVLPLLFLRIALNALDGMVAQAQGGGGPKGEMVNEFSDRVSDVVVFGGLLAGAAMDVRLAAALLAAVLLVSYLGILAKAVGAPRNYAGPFGKADRMFWLGLGLLAAYLVPRYVPEWTAGRVLDVAGWFFLGLALATLINRTRQAMRGLPQ